MLKFGCTSPILANNWLHKSTSATIYTLIESDKNWAEEIHMDMASGLSAVITRKAAVVETHSQVLKQFYINYWDSRPPNLSAFCVPTYADETSYYI